MNDKFELQNKIYKILVKGIMTLSFLSIIGNLIIGLDFIVNVKWIFTFVTSIILIFQKQSNLKFVYFLGVIMILIPIGWIDAGGAIANSISYVFLLMLTTAFLFPKKQRNILVTILIFIVFFLFFLERYMPGIARDYSLESQYFDRLFQVPLTLIAGYWILVQFANSYIEDKKKLEEANEKLTYLAMHDPLTKVNNRRAFDEKLKEVLSTGKHLEVETWIVLFDIDCFKSINDTFGHNEGDKIIRQLGMTAKKVLNNNSFISRWGGDEFCVIVFAPKWELLGKIEEFFNEVRFIRAGETQSVTISAGITRIKADDNILSIFKRADSRLYKAKKQGKDRYIILAD